MAVMMQRNPDYLWRHKNLSDRVRNLETGVHPTRTNIEYFDSTDWTVIPITDTAHWEPATAGTVDKPPRWRKRIGQIHLFGGWESKSGMDSFASIGPNGALMGTLPDEARPEMDMIVWAQALFSPFQIRMTIGKNGNITIFNPTGMPSNRGNILMDGITYIPG